MSAAPAAPAVPKIRAPGAAPRSRWRRALRAQGLLLLLYLVLAYVLIPAGWRFHARRQPQLHDLPRITRTGNGIPGDPLNIALAGSRETIVSAMLSAGWNPADPITLRSSLRIARASVFGTAYPDAPVSNLYLDGKKQDLAFEKAAGKSPRQRHHVRFWRTDVTLADGSPLWVGAATFDRSVGLSHRTGQVTHHIAANVDAERNEIVSDLERIHRVQRLAWIDHFHHHLSGKNGGGDPWHTDGRLAVVELAQSP